MYIAYHVLYTFLELSYTNVMEAAKFLISIAWSDKQ